jgi:D-3-phosphoglycerate dehydrogenase
MSKFTVLAIDESGMDYAFERKILDEIDAEIQIHKYVNEATLLPALAEPDAVLVALTPITPAVIGAMKNCKVISRYGIGVDNIDIDAATKAGIQVARVPDYALEDVSDHALALLMSCIRSVAFYDRQVRADRWHFSTDQPVHRIKGRVLGLLGFGAIARVMNRKVSGLGLSRVLAFDPYVDESVVRDAGAEPVDLDTLLAESDYISVHSPLTDETKGIINAAAIEKMKDGAIIVNTARGPILDELAVANALKSNKLAYAGLDVNINEPLEADSPLRGLDNCILTGHSAWFSVEANEELRTKGAINVRETLLGRPSPYPVNEV